MPSSLVGNLLVNADCELKVGIGNGIQKSMFTALIQSPIFLCIKICDFGLARGFSDSPESNQGFMTVHIPFNIPFTESVFY
jgi:hypothetical protein